MSPNVDATRSPAKPALRALWIAGFLCGVLASTPVASAVNKAMFNVKDYGATGQKADDARPSIQKAIDACAAAGGGTVYFPPGEYTSGSLHLRSHVQIEIEAGATVFALQDPKAYEFGGIPSKASLFYGENLENVSLVGRGTVDGQAQYEWRRDEVERAFDHRALMVKLGKSLMRPFPKGFPHREVFPHLLWLGRSKDIRVEGLKFLRASSWTLALYACDRASFDRLHIHSSLQEAVWADGIDLDGCRDVSISNCTIETGDDCMVFISTDAWGPALPCENITVSHCRLSSASAGVKFSEGNRVGIRRVLVTHTILSNVNRGFVFSTTLGGHIEDVTLSDLIIDCSRFDWFWAGDGQPFHFRITRLSEFNKEPAKPGEAPPGLIRNVVIKDVLAHAKGTSLIHGHAESWLDGLTFRNVRLFMSADPAAPYDKAEHALDFRRVRNLNLRDVEVSWEKPTLDAWQSALYLEEIDAFKIEGFAGRSAWPKRDTPAVLLNNVRDGMIRHARASAGTGVFLELTGQETRDVVLQGSDLRNAQVPWRLGREVRPDAFKSLNN